MDKEGLVLYSNFAWSQVFDDFTNKAAPHLCDLVLLAERCRLWDWLQPAIETSALLTRADDGSGPVALLRGRANGVGTLLVSTADRSARPDAQDAFEPLDDTRPFGLWELNAKTGQPWMSAGLLRLHGRDLALLPKEAPASPRDILRLYPKPERQRLYGFLRDLGAAPPGPFRTLTLSGPRGTQHQVEIHGRADAQGRGLLGLVQNVTGPFDREAEPVQLAALASITSNGVILTDRENRIRWINKGFTALLGYRLADVLGKTTQEALPSVHADPAVMVHLNETRAAFRGTTIEVLNRHIDGRDRAMVLDLQPTRSENGTVTGYIYLLTDIDALRRAEHELRTAEALASRAQQRFVSAIEALDDAFVLFDGDDHMVLCNQRYRDAFGYLGDLVQPGVSFETLLRASVEHGEPKLSLGRKATWLAERMDDHRSPKYETERFLGGRWIRIVEKQTEEGGMVGLRIDITELKEKQAELEAARKAQEAQRELLETTLDRLGQAVHVFDADQRLIYFNQRFLQMMRLPASVVRLGVRAEDILRFRFERGDFGDVDFNAFLHRRLGLLAGATSHSFVAEQPDGRMLQIDGNPLPSGGMVSTYQDITREETLRNDLRRARSEAEAANDAKSRLIASVSHEIRTPLNGVLGMAQALRDTDLSEQQSEMLDLIESSGRSLVAILNDVLDLSKIEAGKFELTPAPFDLAQLVREVERNHSLRASERRLAFRISADAAALGWYRGDAVRVRQILDNLLTNAFRYTQSGGVYLSVDRIVERSPDGGHQQVVFTVRDTGIGIARARLKDLFRPFSQADDASCRPRGGTGLGLAITRELCEMMDGSIEVESEIGVGSTFRARISLEPTQMRKTEAAKEPITRQLLARLGLRILVAEDNATNQVVVRHMLRKINARLTIASNGEEALQAWAPGRFDVMLLDISMPLRDGAEVAAEIRRAEAETGAPRTPIAALTAHAMAHEIGAYLAAGMDLHIAKPMREEALLDALAKLVLPKDAL
ncbi:MAG: PAS-domain containing protein [Pseudomonadota bacterium]